MTAIKSVTFVSLLGLLFFLRCFEGQAFAQVTHLPLSGRSPLIRVEINSEDMGYKIRTRMPNVHALDLPAETASTLKSRIKFMLRNHRKTFLSNLTSARPPLFINGRQDYAYLENTYLIRSLNSRVLSMQFDFEAYLPREHPIHFSEVINYDIHARSFLSLPDLFDSEYFENGMRAIAEYSRNELQRKLQTDIVESGVLLWIAEGTKPSLENFRAFTVSNEGVHFTFEEYQVAAYCHGPQSVTVPWGIIVPFRSEFCATLMDSLR